MRRCIGIAGLFVVAMVLQPTLFDFVKIAGVKPDLVLLLVIFFAFTNGPVKGAFFGFLLGLLEDLTIGYNIGLNALALTLAGLIAGWFETKTYKENLLMAIVVVFLASFLSQLMIWFAGFMVGYNWVWADSLRLAVALAIYNTCLVPFTYPWFQSSITRGFLRYRAKHER